MEETLGLGARLSFPGRRVSVSQDRCEAELGKAMRTSSSPCAVRWETLILCVQQDSGLTGLLLGVLTSGNSGLELGEWSALFIQGNPGHTEGFKSEESVFINVGL